VSPGASAATTAASAVHRSCTSVVIDPMSTG
jgi:hypothetical protein